MPEEKSLKDHLLSIFPLRGMMQFARVSCVALGENSLDCSEPFTTSRAEWVERVAAVFSTDEVREMMNRLDDAETIQISITLNQARHLGFVSKVN